jgi:serine/threonine protein kinase
MKKMNRDVCESFRLLSSSSIYQEQKQQEVINKLKSVSQDLINKFNESQGSFSSELSLCVNDSAKGLPFKEVYDKQDVLGQGGFAIVYRCQHKQTNNTYAVKEVFNKDYEASDENVKEEISAMKKLKDGSSYIVRLLDVFISPSRTCLIMEEMRGGDLLTKLMDKVIFSEAEGRKISRRLLEAVSFCHKKGIAHRDIKMENILLPDPTDDTKIKLADFGCSKQITGKNCFRTLCGSPQYVAPDLYLQEDGYSEKCDLWSVGVVIYILLGGYAPFEAPHDDLPYIICQGDYEFHEQYWKEISSEPIDLISSLLVVDSEKRATIESALDSEWLRRRDMETVIKYRETFDSSSTNTFDAWVRLQNESSHTIFNPLDTHFQRTHAKVQHVHDETEVKGYDSARSLYIEDL